MRVLRQLGCSVEDLSAAGGGFPDLLVWTPFKKTTLLMEIKNPATKGRLNPRQQKWHAEWRGQVCVVSSVEQALREIGLPDPATVVQALRRP